MTNKKEKPTKKHQKNISNESPHTIDEELPEFSLQKDEKIQHPSRNQIALDTLARYSSTDTKDFQKFVLLTNFPFYVDAFAEKLGVSVHAGSTLKVAHCPSNKISIIDYRVGAPMAALIMDLLSYTKPQCVVMLGLCGGLHRSQKVGDFLLPMAAIRDEGASMHYMPPQVPSLPALLVQQFISEELLEKKIDFKTGVIHTTDYRMWEFDEDFRARLKSEKATAIDMECSALFTAGFRQKVPVGALMLISDLPLKPEGIKTKASAEDVINKYTNLHLQCGIDAIQRMRNETLKRKLNFRRFHF